MNYHYYGWGGYSTTTTAPHYSACLSDRPKQRLRTKLRQMAAIIQDCNTNGTRRY